MDKSRKPRPKTGWQQILTFLPDGWEEQAYEKKAMSFSRKYDPESLLRSILIYLSCNGSLQQTTFLTSLLDLTDASSAAFHNRFIKSGDWLLWLAEQTMLRKLAQVSNPYSMRGHRLRIIDATIISPQGTGVGEDTQRLHYSLLYPSNLCSEFHLTTSRVGESFQNFNITENDLVMGDRVYASANGIAHVVDHGGDVLVRVKATQFPISELSGERIDLLGRLKSLRRGKVRTFEAQLMFGVRRIPGRICALKLSSDAARKAKKRALKSAQKGMRKIKPETLQAAEYLTLFTTLPAWELSAREAVALYKYRWQAETNFKRAKSLFGLGALPCHEEGSVKAWIYGKLLVHFLTKMQIPETGAFPPSGPKSTVRNKSFSVARGKIMAHPHRRKRQAEQPSHRVAATGAEDFAADGGL